MTKIKDLIATLKIRNPEAQVFMMTTRKQPFENRLLGVVGRNEMVDQRWRTEPGIATDDAFLVVGPRIRPGSLSAWIIAEHRAATAPSTIEVLPRDEHELMAATLADIAREHLRIESLEEAGLDSSGIHCLGAGDLRRALEAAYLAGGSARGRASDAHLVDDAEPIDAEAVEGEEPIEPPQAPLE